MTVDSRSSGKQGRPSTKESRRESIDEAAERAMRSTVYSCIVCDYVKGLGFDNIEAVEKSKYLHHLKAFHGLER